MKLSIIRCGIEHELQKFVHYPSWNQVMWPEYIRIYKDQSQRWRYINFNMYKDAMTALIFENQDSFAARLDNDTQLIHNMILGKLRYMKI